MTVDLTKYDITLLVDKSGSMTQSDGGTSRWENMQKSAIALTTFTTQYNKDGITLGFFDIQNTLYEKVTSDKVAQLFKDNSPMGASDVSTTLKKVLDSYIKHTVEGGIATKPLIVLCVVSGEFNEKSLNQVLTETAKKLDNSGELKITFIQIGKDPKIATALEHLETVINTVNKKGEKINIVAVKPLKKILNMSLEEVLKASLTD
jgi:uncharacterized protein with von Willebrand factor type A (vWA) domain